MFSLPFGLYFGGILLMIEKANYADKMVLYSSLSSPSRNNSLNVLVYSSFGEE